MGLSACGYSDHAISGASLLRAGVQALIADALRGRFQIMLAEAMDRLSRDQEDIAGLFKRMVHANVKIITLSEGALRQPATPGRYQCCRAPPAQHHGHRADGSFRNHGHGNVADNRRPQTLAVMDD